MAKEMTCINKKQKKMEEGKELVFFTPCQSGWLYQDEKKKKEQEE